MSLILSLLLCTLLVESIHCRSFTIDYENDCFLKDGQPFRYVSGGMHYFRVPRAYWKDRLLKIKASGLNAVQTYIAWNIHEPEKGKYNFEADADLLSFIELVNETGLLLIIRPGPYICAEWDFGGFPSWLLKNSSIILRSSEDPAYISAVTSWFKVLFPKLRPYLYSNGGPIISAQVENEYGSYYTCDKKYMQYLQTLYEEYLGKDVILFTVDGDSESDLKCGTLPSLFTTVDFGSGTDPKTAFAIQRKFQPHGPLVNTEYYSGWLDQWGVPHQTTSADAVANTLDKMLALNASVNFYMFEGGTNFGFMNGATFSNSVYRPCTTSYDYDAPISEAGDPTEKYYVLRKVITKYLPIPKIPVPPPTPKHAYGKIMMNQIGSLWDLIEYKLSSAGIIKSKYPLTMEQMDMKYGFVLYSTTITQKLTNMQQMSNLSIPGVRDRAIIFVNRKWRSVIYRNDINKSLKVNVSVSWTLDILVENEGRINYGDINDPKGLIRNVTVDGQIVTNWIITHVDLQPSDFRLSNNFVNKVDERVMGFFKGKVPRMPDGKPPQDTYLLLKGWSKGQAFLNDFNLGRYWPVMGPQVTLYVPASVFSQNGDNILTLFEVDRAPCDIQETCYVEMVTTPILNGTTFN